jgi:hypothetical protein
MTSRYNIWKSLTWYDVDETTNEWIRKDLTLAPDIEDILQDIWECGVFYINSLTDYGVPVCEKAIRKALQLNPPIIINFRTLRVN